LAAKCLHDHKGLTRKVERAAGRKKVVGGIAGTREPKKAFRDLQGSAGIEVERADFARGKRFGLGRRGAGVHGKEFHHVCIVGLKLLFS
jgi:hypothetical protein